MIIISCVAKVAKENIQIKTRIWSIQSARQKRVIVVRDVSQFDLILGESRLFGEKKVRMVKCASTTISMFTTHRKW